MALLKTRSCHDARSFPLPRHRQPPAAVPCCSFPLRVAELGYTAAYAATARKDISGGSNSADAAGILPPRIISNTRERGVLAQCMGGDVIYWGALAWLGLPIHIHSIYVGFITDRVLR